MEISELTTKKDKFEVTEPDYQISATEWNVLVETAQAHATKLGNIAEGAQENSFESFYLNGQQITPTTGKYIELTTNFLYKGGENRVSAFIYAMVDYSTMKLALYKDSSGTSSSKFAEVQLPFYIANFSVEDLEAVAHGRVEANTISVDSQAFQSAIENNSTILIPYRDVTNGYSVVTNAFIEDMVYGQCQDTEGRVMHFSFYIDESVLTDSVFYIAYELTDDEENYNDVF